MPTNDGKTTWVRMASLKTPEQFWRRLEQLGVELPFDRALASGPASPLAQPLALPGGRTVGNRFCAHPMEGWDATPEGKPTELTRRRWRGFGRSGAKLIWGGEATAVCHEGRGNPRQLLIVEENLPQLATLRDECVAEHERHFGTSDDLLVGLQLTHSGRFSCPNDRRRPEPCIVYRHPVLDRQLHGLPEEAILSDVQIERIIARFVTAAQMAQEAGFSFVDVKHCHGYLGHEFLTAHGRPGPYGGSFENRTRFARDIIDGIRRRTPQMLIGVRLSAFDTPPFRPGADGRGIPADHPVPYRWAFGADPENPLQPCRDEPLRFIRMLIQRGVRLVNVTAGSPYYNPHITRPAMYPPSDGYLPPEDPLVGVARHLALTAALKSHAPELVAVASGLTYLQEWLPHVAQAAVRAGSADSVGLGRMMLPYPEMPADILKGDPLRRKRICRTFSDCTTAPRHGLVSGCYPLDPFYRQRPESRRLKQIKNQADGA